MDALPSDPNAMVLPPQEAEIPAPLGVYVHVPFCAHTCDFCAFYQEAPNREELLRYLQGMRAELASWEFPRRVDTVFWGGGTPGLLPPGDLASLGEALLSRLPEPPQEWTVEMAPSTVKEDKLRVLRDLGVTRISLGVQSFQEETLTALGRRHGLVSVRRAIDAIRRVGFTNLNLDLIFAIPGQPLESWKRDLREAVAVAPEHLSTYCLTFEEDTRLYLKLQQGVVQRREEDEEVAFYECSMDTLEEAGLPQYEISNFARPGFACQHNLNTWEMWEWVGVGPSAASQFGGRRFANPDSLPRWLEGLAGTRERFVDVLELDPPTLVCDALIFGLRRNQGVDLAALRQRFPAVSLGPWEDLFTSWREAGLAELQEPETLRLTRSGRMVADAIGLEILTRQRTMEE